MSGRGSTGSGASERVIVGDRKSGGARAGMPTGVRPERQEGPAGQAKEKGN
jgi:hypothetical protein